MGNDQVRQDSPHRTSWPSARSCIRCQNPWETCSEGLRRTGTPAEAFRDRLECCAGLNDKVYRAEKDRVDCLRAGFPAPFTWVHLACARRSGGAAGRGTQEARSLGRHSRLFGRSNSLNRLNRILVPVVLLGTFIAVAGCGKKHRPPPPAETAPPMPAPAPTAQITAVPTLISAGDQVQLNWRTTDATAASIDGIGDVPTSGVRTVTPSASTSYHLVAHGDGGTAEATARVTVNSSEERRVGKE